jgi:hypothetical protein
MSISISPASTSGAYATGDPIAVLQAFAIHVSPPLYIIGTFDAGITVLRQQVRAFDLAWSLIEAGRIPHAPAPPTRIAVIGAGFAGLSFAAAMLSKQVNCEIILFEEHDTLMPLQQGSDTRWLHPHIYDWPDEGSETDVAMLPLLNWTAARASDVAVQVLQSWKRIARRHTAIQLYCNTRHLQVSQSKVEPMQARVEWVGDKRNAADGTSLGEDGAAIGRAECFDLVVLAVGFGIEDGQPSYWRNETMGQPNLHQHRRTHLVSGQGDGALIDLFRLRISQYRQDRILEEMFAGTGDLLVKLRKVKVEFETGTGSKGLFERFDTLFGNAALDGPPDPVAPDEAREVLKRLARRLRRDTDAVLQLKVRELAELLEPATSRTSFQNALLAYLLYRVGGFAPSSECEETLLARYGIPVDQVVRRHGTKRLAQLERLLSPALFKMIDARNPGSAGFAMQRPDVLWPGGYFGYPGRTADLHNLTSDQLRSGWRKEYLPGPTELVAATICGAVVGVIRDMRPSLVHVRVTLHRVLPLGREVLLQQACDYQGQGFDAAEPTAGRTFPNRNAMIGLAWRCRRPAQTRATATEAQLQEAMRLLDLHDAARAMMPDVSYVLAIPVLQPETDCHAPGPVAAILYLDSKDDDFALSDAEVDRISAVARNALQTIATRAFGGVRNSVFLDAPSPSGPPEAAPQGIEVAIELLEPARAAILDRPFVLNFDRVDPASPDSVDV